MTQHGLYSVIEDKEPGYLLIRTRRQHDLENLANLVTFKTEIKQSDAADYRYSIRLKRGSARRLLAATFDHINYPNFRDAISKTPDQREKFFSYRQIWSTLSPKKF
ncbi:MAG: hypothetical protein O3C20_03110 [Verrucomicrobia bacterium]|nr:hypothetical protein [Verrucomicrobiota bacterium]